MQVMWKRRAIVNQICLSKRFSFEHIRWYSKRKLTNTPAVIFSCPCRGRWFIFTKQIIIVLFWVIIYSYLQKFFNIGDLKLCTIRRKIHESEFLFNQPAACYFFSKRLRPRYFLWNFGKLSRAQFLQSTLKLLLLYLWNIFVI